MALSDDLINLRITLNKLCDGFSVDNSSKNSILTNRIKILYILSEKDVCPSMLINELCIAKSNLANIIKPLLEENVVTSYKTSTSSKNINYSITEKGLQELNNYKTQFLSEFKSKLQPYDFDKELRLTNILNQLIKILKENKDDQIL